MKRERERERVSERESEREQEVSERAVTGKERARRDGSEGRTHPCSVAARHHLTVLTKLQVKPLNDLGYLRVRQKKILVVCSHTDAPKWCVEGLESVPAQGMRTTLAVFRRIPRAFPSLIHRLSCLTPSCVSPAARFPLAFHPSRSPGQLAKMIRIAPFRSLDGECECTAPTTRRVVQCCGARSRGARGGGGCASTPPVGARGYRGRARRSACSARGLRARYACCSQRRGVCARRHQLLRGAARPAGLGP